MKEFVRIPIFCKENLEGYFRYTDKFQLYPFSSKFINIPTENINKPILLEFSFEKLAENQNNDLLIRTAEQLNLHPDELGIKSQLGNEAVKILNLLSVCTNHEFSIYSYEKCWIRAIGSDRSSVGYKEFNYAEFEQEHPLRITNLSEDISYTPVQVVDYFDYIVRGTFKTEQAISIHSELNPLLDRYYKLSPTNKAKIDAICSLFKGGLRVDGYSKSIPFIVFTSCIEALTDIEFEEENKLIKSSCECQSIEESFFKCKKCDKPVWGMSFKFKEVLRRYAEDSKSANSLYNKWYSIRSGIVHYGKLLLADIEIGWNDENKRIQESIDLKKIKQVTKITIINWLLQSEKAK